MFGKSGKILPQNDNENPKFASGYQIASGLCGPLSRKKAMPSLKLAPKERMQLLTPFAAQRFLSSAINQWKTIEKGFSVLHAAFYTVHSGADEDFPLQYKVFGQDFVPDLLGLFDITAPLSELMTSSY